MTNECLLCGEMHNPFTHVVSASIITVERCRICGDGILDTSDRAGEEPLHRSCLDVLGTVEEAK